MVKKVKAVFFDLDNTLIDFFRFKLSCIEAGIEGMMDAGLEIEKDYALKLVMEIYEKKNLEYKNVFNEFLEKVLGYVDIKILAAGVANYRKRRIAFLDTYPNVKPTLVKLIKKDLVLGIISDAPALKAWMRLYSSGLYPFFDYVITYDDVKERKPSQKAFKKAIELSGIKAEEILYVGDMISRDILGAKKCGMKTCFAKYGCVFEDPKEAYKNFKIKPDYTIEKFSDLLELEVIK